MQNQPQNTTFKSMKFFRNTSLKRAATKTTIADLRQKHQNSWPQNNNNSFHDHPSMATPQNRKAGADRTRPHLRHPLHRHPDLLHRVLDPRVEGRVPVVAPGADLLAAGHQRLPLLGAAPEVHPVPVEDGALRLGVAGRPQAPLRPTRPWELGVLLLGGGGFDPSPESGTGFGVGCATRMPPVSEDTILQFFLGESWMGRPGPWPKTDLLATPRGSGDLP